MEACRKIFIELNGINVTTLYDNVCQRLAAGQWFYMGTSVSSTKKTDRHDITEILLKVALNPINQIIP
jgi:hypothetical protein